MFAMNAIKSFNNSIRGPSALMKGPIFASMLRRGGPSRPDQEEMGKTIRRCPRENGNCRDRGDDDDCGGGVAGKWPQSFKKMGEINGKFMWENLHVCVGSTGGGGITAATAAAKNYSPVSTKATPRLFSSFIFNRSISRVRSLAQLVWYGQMSSAVRSVQGLPAVWQHLVGLETDRRMNHDRRKMMEDYEFYQQELVQQKTAAEALKNNTAWQVEDSKAIEDYSDEGYSEMNAALRCPSQMTDDIQVRVDAVVAAMAKLAKIQGKVYRRSELPDVVARNLQVGAEYKDLGFMSTSRDLEQTAYFQGEYLFVICCMSGVDITEHAVCKDEAEVLYPPGTRFLIQSVKTEIVWSEDQGDEEVIVVEMEEVAAKKPTHR